MGANVISAEGFVYLLRRARAAAPGEPPLPPPPPGLQGMRIPTGPFDPPNVARPQEYELEVADAVDLRGVRLNGPVFAYGLRFRGRVDLRGATIQGELDLTACVFEEDLRLDDAEIGSSLRLPRVSAERLSMNGIVVRGRTDLRECRTTAGLSLINADLEGDLDLRGLSARSLRMRGSRLRGDLRLGCSPESDKGPGLASRLEDLDAEGCRIDGSVYAVGTGYGHDAAGAAEWSDQPTLADTAWPAAFLAASDAWRAVGPSLRLSGAHIRGGLRVLPYIGQGSRHQWTGDAEESAVGEPLWPLLEQLDLRHAVIGNDLRMAGALVRQAIDARGLSIEGAVDIGLAELWRTRDVRDGNEDTPAVRILRQSRVRGRGRGDHDAVDLGGSRIGGQLLLRALHVEGSLRLDLASLGHTLWILPHQRLPDESFKVLLLVPTFIENDLRLFQASVAGPITLFGVRIGGELVMASSRCGSYVRLEPWGHQPCRIDGDLDFHSACMVMLDMEGVHVGGQLRLNGCEVRDVSIGPGLLTLPHTLGAGQLPGWSPGMPTNAIVPTRVGYLQVRHAHVRGDLGLEYLQVMRPAPKGEPSVSICDCEIDGSVSFANPWAIDRLYDSTRPNASGYDIGPAPSLVPASVGASVMGGLRINRCRIGAAVKLGGLKVDGVLDLEDSRVGGDLEFGGSGRQRAWCRQLKLRMAQCANDVSLCGLSVVRGGALAGGIDAQYLGVTGDLLLTDKGGGAGLAVEGCLDLSHARVAHLCVGGSHFSQAGSGHTPESAGTGLILDRMQVQRLEVCTATDLPYPLSIDDVMVEVWSLVGDDDFRYGRLLAQDIIVRRSTYMALEASLRRDGETGAADKLYRALRRRVGLAGHQRRKAWLARVLPTLWPVRATVSHALRVLQLLLAAPYRYLLGFGTSALPLLGLILLLWVLAFPVHYNPHNFEPTSQVLTLPGRRAGESVRYHKGDSPTPGEWGLGDAVQVSLKTHLPILPLHARDDWQARDSNPAVWSLDQDFECSSQPSPGRGLCLPLPAEDVLNFMQILNWVLWPLLLSYLIRRLLRNA